MASSPSSNSTGPASNPSDQLAVNNEARNRQQDQFESSDVVDSVISLVSSLIKSYEERISELNAKLKETESEIGRVTAQKNVMTAEMKEMLVKLLSDLKACRLDFEMLTKAYSSVIDLSSKKDREIDEMQKQFEECQLRFETVKEQLEDSRHNLKELMAKQRMLNIRCKTVAIVVSLASFVCLYKAGGLRLSRSSRPPRDVLSGNDNVVLTDWSLEHVTVGVQLTAVEEKEEDRQQDNPVCKLMKAMHTFVLRFIGALFKA